MFVFFCQFVNGLTEFYPEIYDGDGVTSQHQVNFSKKWGAYQAIIELANGDILKINQVVEEPLEKCLLYLSYKADKIHVDNLLHNEAMKKVR